MPKIALLTCAELPRLTEDDRLLLEHLPGAKPVRWGGDLSRYDVAVLRSTWDYHLKAEAFARWARRQKNLLNPAKVVLWNMDKSYLKDCGVPIVPTVWVPKEWKEVVLKPTVSASAWRTERLAGGGLMIQPFLPEVQKNGEWSLIFLAGRFSHAVLKRPGRGDFRVQSEFGGSVEAASPSRSTLRAAEKALAAVPGRCLYARVDGFLIKGRFLLSEIELIEPALFLKWGKNAARDFARAIMVESGR
jgi:hypothetical protein